MPATLCGTVLKASTWRIIRQGRYNRVGHDRGEHQRIHMAATLRRWRSEGRHGRRAARETWSRDANER